MAGQARGSVTIDVEECKGCGLCVDSCPPKCLQLATNLSAYGVHPAHYLGGGCTGCGICFYCCPEPGAITVYRLKAVSRQHSAGGESLASRAPRQDEAEELQKTNGLDLANVFPSMNVQAGDWDNMELTAPVS